MFLIVEFDCNEVALVPQNWMVGQDDKSVMWPPYKNTTRINNAASKKEPPSESWTEEEVRRVLYRNECFEKVRAKLKQAEEESDLQTENEASINKRKRRAPNWMTDDSESEDERIPPVQMPGHIDVHTSPSPTPTPQRPTPPPRVTLPARGSIQTIPSNTVQRPTGPNIVEPRAGVTGSNMYEPRAGSSSPVFGPATVAQLFTTLENMREEQREMRRMLQVLISRGPAVEDNVAQLPEGMLLPVKTIEEMSTVDDLLKETENMSLLVRYLSMIGGANLKETVGCFFKEVMTNDLTLRYNFQGKKGKQKFSCLQIMTVLYKCVQRNHTTKGATRKEVEVEVRKWLAGARDREGGRKKRSTQIHTTRDEDEHGNSSD